MSTADDTTEHRFVTALVASTDLEAVATALSIASSDDILDPRLRWVRDAVEALHPGPHGPVDLFDFRGQQNGLAPANLDLSYLLNLDDPSALGGGSAPWWGERAHQVAQQRRIKRLLSDAATRAENADPAQLADMVEQIGAELASLSVTAVREMVNHTDIDGRYPPVDWQVMFSGEQDTGVRYLVEGIIPARGFVIIWARTGAGKSLVVLELLMGLSLGRPVFGGIAVDGPHRVLVLDYENDPANVTTDRLIDAGWTVEDMTNLVLLSFPALPPLNTEAGGRELLQLIRRHRAEVLFIDTFDRSVAGDPNSQEVTEGFNRYTGIPLRQAGITLIRADQAGKDSSRGPIGSMGKVTDVDMEWQLTAAGTVRTLKLGKRRGKPSLTVLELTEATVPYFHHRASDDVLNRSGLPVRICQTVLDDLKIPVAWGRDRVRKAIAESGRPGFRNEILSAAMKARRDITGPVPGGSGTGPTQDVLPGQFP